VRIDWPLAIELTAVFCVMSWVRWRWFKARMGRAARRGTPPAP